MCDFKDEFALITAIENNRNIESEKLHSLIQSGITVSINAKNKYGCASINLVNCCSEHYLKVVMPVLIEAGADVNTQDNHGSTPLMKIMEFGGYQTIPLMHKLIHAGADINIQNKEGNTVLHFVAESGLLDNEKVMRILIDSSACVNVKNIFGRTPLMVVAEMVVISRQI